MEKQELRPILYSVPEAAAKLGVSATWLYERTRRNAVPCHRFGKYVRFSESDLEAIIADAYCPASGTNGTIGYNGDYAKEQPQKRYRISGPH